MEGFFFEWLIFEHLDSLQKVILVEVSKLINVEIVNIGKFFFMDASDCHIPVVIDDKLIPCLFFSQK